MTVKYSKSLFILLPAIAMMLGWGLRGHIGGGPFGAMIPGAMVALSISLLLKLPPVFTSILVVFGVFGIGLGGEMTYGQTLGFLRNPDTVWWGTAGTTLKGLVWGFLGGAVFSLGFLFNRIPGKIILKGLVMMMAGYFLGFKLINEPMILYFSDPANPRAESWAALLFGGIALLTYLRFQISAADFRLARRFALYGLVGGGLGFGLGGFWMVLGSHLPDVLFRNWWKAMEFTFGFLLGGGLGLAAWKSRHALIQDDNGEHQEKTSSMPLGTELGLLLAVALFIHWFFPNVMDSVKNAIGTVDGFWYSMLRGVARVLSTYAFAGFLLVLLIMRFPKIAWQFGITLTFCHAAIDLVRDFYPDRLPWDPFTMHFFWVLIMTANVALLTVYFSRGKNSVINLFLLLIWSSIIISLIRLGLLSGSLSVEGMSICQIVCNRFFVDIFFIILAIAVTWIILPMKRIRING